MTVIRVSSSLRRPDIAPCTGTANCQALILHEVSQERPRKSVCFEGGGEKKGLGGFGAWGDLWVLLLCAAAPAEVGAVGAGRGGRRFPEGRLGGGCSLPQAAEAVCNCTPRSEGGSVGVRAGIGTVLACFFSLNARILEGNE